MYTYEVLARELETFKEWLVTFDGPEEIAEWLGPYSEGPEGVQVIEIRAVHHPGPLTPRPEPEEPDLDLPL